MGLSPPKWQMLATCLAILRRSTLLYYHTGMYSISDSELTNAVCLQGRGTTEIRPKLCRKLTVLDDPVRHGTPYRNAI